MDHIDQAIYDTVHSSAISAKSIAKRLGMSHQVLLNKANPQSEFHKLTLREAVAIQLITSNNSIHRAIGIELASVDELPQAGLLETVLAASREHGDVVRAIDEALSDGRFTLREVEACQQEIDDAIKALTALRQSIVAQHRLN